MGRRVLLRSVGKTAAARFWNGFWNGHFLLLKWGCTDDCTVIGAAAAVICSFPFSASLVASRGNDHDHGGCCCCCCCGDVLLETADLVRELLGCCHFSFLRVNWLKIEDNFELDQNFEMSVRPSTNIVIGAYHNVRLAVTVNPQMKGSMLESEREREKLVEQTG